jgi:hypothetical protein
MVDEKDYPDSPHLTIIDGMWICTMHTVGDKADSRVIPLNVGRLRVMNIGPYSCKSSSILVMV